MFLIGLGLLAVAFFSSGSLNHFTGNDSNPRILRVAASLVWWGTSLVGYGSVLFVVISSVLLRGFGRAFRSHRQIAMVSVVAVLGLMIAQASFSKWVSHRNSVRAEQTMQRVEAELVTLTAGRDLAKECWGKERNLELFSTGRIFADPRHFQIFGDRSLGNATFPSQAGSMVLMSEMDVQVGTYDNGARAYAYVLRLCFVSFEAPKVMVFEIREGAPLAINLGFRGGVLNKDGAWREGKRLAQYLRNGGDPLTFAATEPRVSIRLETDEP